MPGLQPSHGGRPGIAAGVAPGLLGTLGGLGFVGVVGVPPVVVSGFAASLLRPPRKCIRLKRSIITIIIYFLVT